MEQFTIQNLTARIADNINYSWILLDEQVNREQFAASLGDASFHALLQERGVRNVLLDAGKLWNFGLPEMSDFLDSEFTAAMRGIGVEKISVILNEEITSMLAFIFQGIEEKHAQSTPQIRFFNTSQFYETFDSVAWF